MMAYNADRRPLVEALETSGRRFLSCPADPHRSPDRMKRRCELIARNLELLKQ